jgi:cbb3-type cytochrome oxidase subunit 3
MMNSLISIGTVICFSFFIAVVIRAFSRKQKSIYIEAANLPFDLPDEFSLNNHPILPSHIKAGR